MTRFPKILLFADPVPRGGPEQMALDEVLLETVTAPVLRPYRWAEPAVSFGYRQSFAAVRRAHPGRPLVRRWTGGGMVEHGADWTFALVVPSGNPFSGVRPVESYRQIHEVLVGEVTRFARGVRLTRPEECLPGEACFSAPALHDLTGPDGRKICGGAQRRTRHGFLHQGSVQGLSLPEGFAVRLAAALAAQVEEFVPSPALAAEVRKVASEKYASPAWREKIP